MSYISFPYEYYLIAVNHKNSCGDEKSIENKNITVDFVGLDPSNGYPFGLSSYKEALHFYSEKEAFLFFGKYKKSIMKSFDSFEAYNPRIIKVTCVEDPIVQGNMERSL